MTATLVLDQFRRRAMISLSLPVLVLAYLAYAAMAFDVAGAFSRMRYDNAQILMSGAQRTRGV